jgi:hypothetical protein
VYSFGVNDELSVVNVSGDICVSCVGGVAKEASKLEVDIASPKYFFAITLSSSSLRE